MSFAALEKKIHGKTCVVGIVGLGYVGLPLAMRFSEVGIKVVGFDINQTLVTRLNQGYTPFSHITADQVQKTVDAGFEATGDFTRASEVDAIILCVPTPLGKHMEPDLSMVLGSMRQVAPHLKSGVLVSLESTTYPGTTEEELLPILARDDFRLGEDFFLVYSPEREDPGRKSHVTKTIPKLVGGVTEDCLKLGVALYAHAVEQVVKTSSPKVAELAKLHENIYRAVNIGLVNEMKMIADRMGIDIYEVIDAASTKPYGFTPFYPGPGLGGHCIPIDPFYLTWKAREYGHHTRFIELAGEINTAMPMWVVRKTAEALNARGKATKDAKILILGVAYKPDISDMRESPALELISLLVQREAKVQYNDPFVPKLPRTRRHDYSMQSQTLDVDLLKAQDCVVICTHHSQYDYEWIQTHAPLVVDTRGQCDRSLPHVIAA